MSDRTNRRHLDNLTSVNEPRRCSRPGCNGTAVATLTYVYADSTAVLGPLSVTTNPHSWDLCMNHAVRFSAPKGWELVRNYNVLPTSVAEENDDLTIIAEAVREVSTAAAGSGNSPTVTPVVNNTTSNKNSTHHDPQLEMKPLSRKGRRGHLRVLPDPE